MPNGVKRRYPAELFSTFQKDFLKNNYFDSTSDMKNPQDSFTIFACILNLQTIKKETFEKLN